MGHIVKILRAITPRVVLNVYHLSLSFISAFWYGFPSRKIKIVGITGTKGKTTTAELVNAVLEASGHTTALAGTLHFKIADKEERNLYKMTMPGRFTLQRLLRNALNAKCDWVVLEMTSQGVLQHRHRFIELDALIFTNLAPEHIEAHGSYENYKDAKLEIAKSLHRSKKKDKVMVSNIDDVEGELFLETADVGSSPYSLEDALPYRTEGEISGVFEGQAFNSRLQGTFNLYNILAALTFAKSRRIDVRKAIQGITNVSSVRGRLEPVENKRGIEIYVDYAHTPDSLKAVYEAFPSRRKVCVLGNTGGGRDIWKRPEMAKIAERHCSYIFLTNEDPYDEDPKSIIKQMSDAIVEKEKLTVELDRRKAIALALKKARKDDVVLITGKGTDPYIMGPRGSKQEWDDATVVREELQKL